MAVDFSAIARWPDVPACYDWLSLDRRGHWRLQGERISHGGLIAFINRQYGCDDSGCWFVQNGPQRVFVSLAYTPWVFRQEDEGFVSQTGAAGGAPKSLHLDEDGHVLLETALGIGLLDDRDLAGFLAQCHDPDARPADENAFLALMKGKSGRISWQGLALKPIAAVDVPQRFNFRQHPQPPEVTSRGTAPR
ncbi:MAG TPA: DUF2946 family protein [Azonexus sp.]|jgi:hypothetical protein|nr:DUF2946 family protein [Azonexus sp.]